MYFFFENQNFQINRAKVVTLKVSMHTMDNLLYSMWNSGYVAAWMGEESGGEWIHVYGWLSPSTVHLKLPQQYKSAIPQYKMF